jgi:hypothetical protein
MAICPSDKSQTPFLHLQLLCALLQAYPKNKTTTEILHDADI